jgi:serine protease Do
MIRFRRNLSALAIAAASVTTGWFGYQAVLNTQFAHAEQQVEATRQQLRNADDLSTVFRTVGKAVEPSVVQIQIHKTVHGAKRLPLDPEMLKRFFPQDQNGQPQLPEGLDPDQLDGGPDMEQVGTGSGVIMDAEGGTAYILTNNHVAGGATEMTVTLSDGRAIRKAKVVGADPKSDLAVVKIEADRVIPAKWGNSDELQKGDWILAFGSPFEYIGSMTHGIVSALNRTSVGILGPQAYENFIQVDAPINPGNSGGPLVNTRGEVVGINTAIASRSGSFSGIGFAIPSNQAKTIYATLKEHGKITRGWLGVGIIDVGKALDQAKDLGYTGITGVLVDQVFAKTPAFNKLQPGDVIEQLNDKPVNDVQQLRDAIAKTAPNTDVKMKVFRDGKEQDVTVKVGEQPEEMMAAAGGGAGRTPGQHNPADVTADKFGLKLQDLTDELAQKYELGDVHEGALVTQVMPRSAAFRANLKPGDVITKVNRGPVKNAKEAADALANGDLAKGVRLAVTGRDGSQSQVFLHNVKAAE